jgi:hypothetical protein
MGVAVIWTHLSLSFFSNALAFRRLLNKGAQYRVDPCLITRTLLLEAIDNIAVEPERQ